MKVNGIKQHQEASPLLSFAQTLAVENFVIFLLLPLHPSLILPSLFFPPAFRLITITTIIIFSSAEMATRMASNTSSSQATTRQPAATSGSSGRNPDRNDRDRRGPGESKVKKAKKVA